MLSKMSIKRPLTIVLAMMLVVILAVVSFTRMPTDLFPEIELPYVAVITTYPGASPEKVEQTVTKPVESALSTTGGVESVTSVSSENMSMVVFEFSYSTNMDSAIIEMNNSLDLVESTLEDGVSSPVIMQISPDMMPIAVASIDADGMDISELSALTNDTIVSEFERVDGVASVTAMGTVQSQISVTLDQDKIDDLNDRILASIDAKLADTKAELDAGDAELASAKAQLDSQISEQNEQLAQSTTDLANGKQQLYTAKGELTSGLTQAKTAKTNLERHLAAVNGLIARIEKGESVAAAEFEPVLDALVDMDMLTAEQKNGIMMGLSSPFSQLQSAKTLAATLGGALTAADSTVGELQSNLDTVNAQLAELDSAQTQLENGKLTISQQYAAANQTIASGQSQLAEGRAQFEQAEKQAYENAGLDGVLDESMIANLLAAENFSMPAGYLKDGEEQYSIKVGDKFSSLEEIRQLVLMDTGIDGIGSVTLSDVASVETTTNAGEYYAKINGNDGILLAMQKQSTASTSEVSSLVRERAQKLQNAHDGLHVTMLSDQGIYIDIIINSVLQNLLFGAVLAILILFLFLRSFKPTLVVALSIPMSLMLAVVLMYFTGVNLNLISLAGLALGVGMLVDNSIVVIENIYRLRAQGVPAAKAAFHGATQVAGAITASTLTTICVFLPIVFTEGMSRELFTDMGLTIAYSLLASLLVALTVAPALASTLLSKVNAKPTPLYDKFTNLYGRALRSVLSHRAIALTLAGALLLLSLFGAASMGTAFIPETDSEQLSLTLAPADEEMTKSELLEAADTAYERIAALEGVQTVGAMESSSLMGSSGSASSVMFYILLDEKRDQSSSEISRTIEENLADLGCDVETAASMDMSAMAGSGIEIDITGRDLDTLQSIAEQVGQIVAETEGTTDIEIGAGESANETRIIVDKNAAMKYSLTVAQIYQQITAAISAEKESTAVTIENQDYPVIVIKDEQNLPTLDSLSSYSLKVSENGEEKTIPLSDIAAIEQAKTPSAISHRQYNRYISVTAAIDADHNIGLVSRDLESKLKGYELPDGYTLHLAGENETIMDTLRDLILMILLAVVLIYVIMAAQFQSLLSPFIVMFTIPLAITGGLLGLWALGFEISVISMLGFLVLAGVVVNNGIVFVDYANKLRLGGYEKRQALILAGKARMRPILMTALTTILGLITLAFGMGTGADMLQPMAVTIIFGLAYATALTLFIVPVLYDLLQRKKPKDVDLKDDEPFSDDGLFYLAPAAKENAAGAKPASSAVGGSPERPADPAQTPQNPPQPDRHGE